MRLGESHNTKNCGCDYTTLFTIQKPTWSTTTVFGYVVRGGGKYKTILNAENALNVETSLTADRI